MRSCAALSLLVVVAVGYLWSFWSPVGRVVRGDGYEGVVRTQGTSAAVLSKDAVAELETCLSTFLRSNAELAGTRLASETSQFRRYYSEMRDGGVTSISVEFHHRASVPRRRWLNGVVVSGGGDLHWRAQYDQHSGTFTNILSNEAM